MIMPGIGHLKLDFHDGVKSLNRIGLEIGGRFKNHFIGVGFQQAVGRQQVADTPVGIGEALAKSGPVQGVAGFSLLHFNGQGFCGPSKGGVEDMGGDLTGSQTAPIGLW